MSQSLRTIKLNIIKYTKDLLLASRLLQLFSPLNSLFKFISGFNELTSWAHKNKNGDLLMNDFYRSKRVYEDREKSFEAVIKKYQLDTKKINYLEFGVASGWSFKWWLDRAKNPNSEFYGFDTFEGLPEDWGVFAKGDMSSSIPVVNDDRAHFIKGIFQNTLNDFLFNKGNSFKNEQKVIHMDADLFSATIFALSQLYPYLNKGDIIMFDEFSVYNHEFSAYKIFTECFYVDLKLISAQNNFYHCIFEVV